MKTKSFVWLMTLVMSLAVTGCKEINPADDGNNHNPSDTTQNNPDTPNPPEPTVVDVSEQLTGNTSKGRLSGIFTIANSYWIYTGGDTGYGGWSVKRTEGKVRFSQGSLQFQASTKTWRFAPNQLTTISEENNNRASSSYSGWIDEFYFGTSGWDNTKDDPYAIYFQPWSRPDMYNLPTYTYVHLYNCVDNAFEHKCDTSYCTFSNLGFGPIPPYNYGDELEDPQVWDETGGSYVSGDKPYYIDIKTLVRGKYRNYDWGWYNKISNGGNKEHLWRTLTYQELSHILFGRPNAEYLKSKCIIVDGNNYYNGIIIMPDDFEPSNDIKWEWNEPHKQSGDYYWEAAEYSMEEWLKLEKLGGVFFPESTFGYSSNMPSGYHTSSHFFQGGKTWQSDYKDYSYGMENYLARVRLVQDVTGRDIEEGSDNPNNPTNPDTPSSDCNNFQASYLPTGASGLGEMKEQLVSGAQSWFYDAKYGARVSKSNTEAWLYTPVYDMRDKASVQVSFQHAINYAGDMATQQTMWVTDNFTGDVTTTNWQQITIPNYPAGNNWTFVSNTVNIPIQYVGEKTVIAFKYTSGSNTSTATWEIKNLTVKAVCANN